MVATKDGRRTVGSTPPKKPARKRAAGKALAAALQAARKPAAAKKPAMPPAASKPAARAAASADAAAKAPVAKRATARGTPAVRGVSSGARPSRPAAREGARFQYMKVYRDNPLDRIRLIKQGLRAVEAKRILGDLTLSQAEAFEALKLSPATVNRKAAQDGILSPDESERVIGMARLIGQVEAMVEESGDPAGFDAAAWISRWLSEPLPALGGVRPVDLMDTMEGQALVSATLARAQSGAYG